MKKEINILAILILAVVIASVIAMAMFASQIIDIVDTINKPYKCIPNIEEAYEGDHIYFYCYKQEPNQEKASSPTI